MAKPESLHLWPACGYVITAAEDDGIRPCGYLPARVSKRDPKDPARELRALPCGRVGICYVETKD